MNIIFEDKDIIVVEKPSGVSSQAQRGSGEDMVSILNNYFWKNGNKNPYVGVVHRLDMAVGGVMVYGKNQKSAAALSSQIASRNVTKKYYAAIYNGDTLESEGKMEDLLIKDGRLNISKVVSSDTKDGKKAELTYRVISRCEIQGVAISFVDITLITGRHHQIRVQFGSRGCPIVGDRKYNNGHNGVGISGIGLYCYSMEIAHPRTGEKLLFSHMPTEGIFKNLKIQ